MIYTIQTILFLVLGFAFLWKGGDYLISGSSAIGRRLRIPSIILGLTLVSFGTSGPELIVNLIASFKQKPDIIMGNIIGSNIANTCLILGLSGSFYPIAFKRKAISFEVLLNIFVSLILIGTVLLFPTSFYVISLPEGVFFLGLFSLYLYRLITYERESIIEDHISHQSSLKSALFLFSMGCVLLPIGGQWVVNSAIKIGSIFNVSEVFMSLFAVAFGTSLPELSATFVAASRRESELAIGNVLGSNLFNVLLILGLSAVVAPIPVHGYLMIDLLLLLLLSLILAVIIFFNKHEHVYKRQAVLLFSIYCMYIIYIFIRG